MDSAREPRPPVNPAECDGAELVLFVTPHIPDPNGNGAERRAWAHLTALAETRRVVMAHISWGQRASLDKLHLSDGHCVASVALSCETRPRAAAPALPGFALMRTAMGRGERYLLAPESRAPFAELLRAYPPDIVFCFRCQGAQFWNRNGRGLVSHEPVLLVDFDDIESIAMQRQLEVGRASIGFEGGLLLRLAARRQRAAERRLLRQSAAVFVCSETDRRILQARVPAAAVTVVPNSVPLPPLPAPAPGGGPAKLLFVGTMSYPPNQHAAVHFCRDVLPIIRERNGEVMVTLVGFRPPEPVRALGAIPNVRVTGEVESVAPYYAEADVVICPIRFGGGTRIKILEAMSFARPVVSTTIGAEGIDAAHGENILIADGPQDFAAACLRLVEEPALRASIGAAGRTLVAETYAAEKVRRTLSAAIDRLAGARPARAPAIPVPTNVNDCRTV